MDPKRGGDLRLILVLAAIVLTLALMPLVLSAPPVDPAPAAGRFDTARAIARLSRILGDQRPHPVDTQANDAVRKRILAEIRGMGYQPRVRDDFSCRSVVERGWISCARVRNIAFRLGPKDARAKAVMVSAHYDSVPAAPGAADDGLGVSVGLEIAHILAAASLQKPVLFLLTDGEEPGLLGAHSFARSDPLADDVSAVVNVEARGDQGAAAMFETSQPNSTDIAVYAEAATRPVSNSMMTDIYRLLPNDTDVTEFLPKGYDVLNTAVVGGVSRYHTPHDNLANLDRGSVQHAGRQALASVLAFANADPKDDEHQVVFTDVLTRFVLVVPQWAGGATVFLGLAVAGLLCVRSGGGRSFRAIIAPAVIVVVAGLVCWLVQTLIALRPEVLYWYAHPMAMELVAWLSAAFAAVLGLKLVAASAGRMRLLHASWFWFASVAGGIWLVAPGASILFALPLFAYLMGVAIGRVAPAATQPLMAVAALVALVVIGQSLSQAAVALGGGAAPVFAVATALVMVVAVPLAVGERTQPGRASFAVAGLALAAAAVAAAVVPGYSPAEPEPLNIDYVVDADARSAQWVLVPPAGDPAPETLATVEPFEPARIDGIRGHALAAPAPFAQTPAPGLNVVSDEAIAGGGRRVRVRVTSNGADRVFFRIPKQAAATAFDAGSDAGTLAGGETTLYCQGRACDGVEFSFTLQNAEPQDWTVFGVRFGLPETAARLVASRPASTTPVQTGDVTMVRTRIEI